MKNYHLVGIGGVGMSAIATLLMKRDLKLSGSDIRENQIIRDLKEKGVDINIGHRRKNLSKNVEALVLSSAIGDDNPEIIEAKRRGIPIYGRAQVLSWLMKGKKIITVTGAHGKTTTASLIAYILSHAGLNPTVAIGGVAKNFSINAWQGDGDYFVAEADESDGSFLNFKPDFSIITNIDNEHLDYYGSFDSLLDSFAKFIDGTRDGGTILIDYCDKNLQTLVNNSGKHYKTFGLDRNADIRAENIKTLSFGLQFDCLLASKRLARISLPLIGEHNIINCLAAILLSLELNIDLNRIIQAIKDYQGTWRRLDLKFRSPKIMLIDDYAHHPTEIKATLKAVKELITANKSYQKIITVFQPHRFSRTKLLLGEFIGAFDLCDDLIITDIYSATEKPIKGINAKILYEEIKKAKKDNVYYLEKQDIIDHVLKHLSGSDVVLFLGAGDITKLADEFREVLERI
ncbi:MAG: UDP-N-acetylmuramate--L-alanine ligase [Candidatus Omnitrophica bacterium]|nr:UDP-N-acetylmuramate--L-alanine ligase [Candidatus Omnitrophota bacterium]